MSNEEWGNIPLPGMTDEELHSKNWNRVDAMKRTWSNSKFRKKAVNNMKKPKSYYPKNRKCADQVKQKISKSLLNQGNKPVIAEGVEYESLKACAEYYGITSSSMSEKVRGNNPNFYYKSPK